MADWRKVYGRIVTDAEGAVGGVSVTVKQTGTSTLVTLKANKAGTEALANPFDTDANGVWAFFTDIELLSGVDYEVDIVFAKSGLDFSVMNEMYENIPLAGLVTDPGAVQEADFTAGTLLYATANATPVATTPTQFMAILSGQAAAAFDWGGQDLLNAGVMFLTEQASAEADVAGKGQIWVKTATPNTLWFTDDAGTDFQLGVGAISIVGTPVDNQLAVWKSASSVEGDTNLTWSGTQLDVTGNLYSDGANVLLDGSTSVRLVSANFIALRAPENRIGFDVDDYMQIALAETTGVTVITHTGSGPTVTWTADSFSFVGDLSADGATMVVDGSTSVRLLSAGYVGIEAPDIRVGFDAGATMSIAVSDTTGATAITHAGSGPTMAWTIPVWLNTNSTSYTTYTPSWVLGFDAGAAMTVAISDTTGVAAITHAGSGVTVTWTAPSFDFVGAISLDGLTISGDTDSAGKLDFQYNPAAGSSTGHIIKGTLTTATGYDTTTAGLMVKEYFADNACTVTGGEFTGIYVNVKQLAALTGGAKSSLISAHNYGSGGDYQSIDYGIILYGDLTAGFELSGGTSAYGIKMGNQTISTAEIQLSSGALIITGSADPNGSVTGVDGSFYLRTGTATATTIGYVCTGTTVWTALGGGAGGGDVYLSGVPVDNQLAIWTDGTHIEGDANLTWDASVFTILGAFTIGASAGGKDVTFWGDVADYKVWFDADGDTNGAWYFGADTKGVMVSLYGDVTGCGVFWDPSTDTNGTLSIGASGGSKGNDAIFYGDTNLSLMHWDQSLNALKLDGATLFIKEQAEAQASVEAYGQIWVDTATPNLLMFTDDADTDFWLNRTAGIADTNMVVVNDAAAADNEYVKFTATGVEGSTYAEVLTDIFSVALPENVSIQLDPALSADGKYSGITEDGTAGATLAFGDLCYLAVADSRWELAKADVAATSKGKLGICVLAATGDGEATTMLMYGKVRADTAFPTFTIGAPVFISAATAGDVTSTAPTGTTDFVVRIVGEAMTGDCLFFKPDCSYGELA